MPSPAIRVENLSKRYRIGAQEHRKTFREAVMETVATPLRRLKSFGQSSHREADSIWALKDVSFDVQPGEVVGIIGPNGAGKSTLLKILSRITDPTEGGAVIDGRVASLLEVGTGFHQELTGRENIHLSGAILGMSNKEMRAKFDEIVDFSGVETFIDTPVKRYSSGMQVRLGFAVAAHLEPEILLIDEVLAVGDAAFRKKCLGKMQDVARGGRTVLFVSHNMGAVRSLCPGAILLEGGRLALSGDSAQVISSYLSSGTLANSDGEVIWRDADRAPGGEELRLRALRVLGQDGRVQSCFEVDKPILVEILYELKRPLRGMRLNLGLLTIHGEIAFVSTDHSQRGEEIEAGKYKSVCRIPGGLLNVGRYIVQVGGGIPGVKELLATTECTAFTTSGEGNQGSNFPDRWPGVVCPKLDWNVERID